MGSWYYLFILGLLGVCSHDRIEEKAYKEAEGEGKANFVATQNWVDLITPPAHCTSTPSSCTSSFSRSETFEEVNYHGETHGQRAMEMQNLQALKQGKRRLLWSMRLPMGAVLGSELLTFQYAQLYGGSRPERDLATLGQWLGRKQLGPETKEPQATIVKKPEIYQKGWKGRKPHWKEPVTGYEVALTSAGLFKNQGWKETDSGASEGDEYQTCGNITRGTRPNTSPPSKLPRWITTGGSIESRQAEAHDHDGSQEAHWAAHQGEKRPRLHESSTCPAQRCVEETRAEPGGKHQGTTTTVSIRDGQLFETCEAELVQAFDGARHAIMEITQQSTPAEEDVKAIKALDSGLLAGGPDAPIEIEEGNEDEEMIPDADATVITQLQSTLSECVNSLADARDTNSSLRPRSRSPRPGSGRDGEKDGTGVKGGGKKEDLWDAGAETVWHGSQFLLSKIRPVSCDFEMLLRSGSSMWGLTRTSDASTTTSTTSSSTAVRVHRCP